MSRKLISIWFALSIIFAMSYILLWATWKHGSVLSSSNWNRQDRHYKIEVRKVPSSAPFWALPLSFIPDDNPFYRCEHYRFDQNTLYSAHTFQGESFTANSARIQWNEQGGAVVYLDQDPVLKCDEAGFWSSVK